MLMLRMMSETKRDNMTANKSNPIIGITLEGFQVFDKPTYIPLDRLTLLFGPNSAGKSAVQDAIELYFALMNSEIRYLQGESEISGLLDRHWRRTSGSDTSQVPIAKSCSTSTPKVG